MITIHGLSDRQKSLLEIMWNCDTQEDLDSWKSHLSDYDQKMVDTLITIIRLEIIENQIEKTNFVDARKVLSRL